MPVGPNRETLKNMFTVGDLFQPPPPQSYSQPKSQPIRVHYSFDMAQQVNLQNIIHWSYSFTTNSSDFQPLVL